MVAARRDEDAPASLNQLTIGREEFLALHKILLDTKAAERLRFDGLDTRRVDLIIAGSMFLATAMELFNFDSITISEWALREGIVLDAVGRHDPADWSDDPRAIRRESVLSLVSALQLGRGARPPGREARARAVRPDPGDPRPRRPTTASCSSSPRCCTTSASTCRARATRATPRTWCATVSSAASTRRRSRCSPRSVRWHRGGDPRVTDEFPLLDARAIERVRVLDGLLRVADGLDRGRNQVVYGVDAMTTPSLVLLRLRAVDDVELEVWGARRKRALLEKVLGREVELSLHPSLR